MSSYLKSISLGLANVPRFSIANEEVIDDIEVEVVEFHQYAHRASFTRRESRQIIPHDPNEKVVLIDDKK
jgi:hypothetical protein